jgi:DnaJ-class molecular chaperone
MPDWQACPVCFGRGHVPAGFYGVAVNTNPETCRTCNGTTVVVRPELPTPEFKRVLR